MSVADIHDSVRRLISEKIDSVTEVEAILLLREHRERDWAAFDVAKSLYVSVAAADRLLRVLEERGFFACRDSLYRYAPSTPELEAVVSALADAYTHQLVAVTRLIHSKASARGS